MEISDNFTTINTREELKRAVELGLTPYLSAKSNSFNGGYIAPNDVTVYFPDGDGDFDLFRWRVLGEHDLSEPEPEQAESCPFKIGDVVRLTATPECTDVPVGTLAVVEKTRSRFTDQFRGLRGVNGETLWDGEDGLLWAEDHEIELVSRGEPKPEPEQAEPDEPSPATEEPMSTADWLRQARLRAGEALLADLFGGDEPEQPEFRITVTIEATSARGYREALSTIASGV